MDLLLYIYIYIYSCYIPVHLTFKRVAGQYELDVFDRRSTKDTKDSVSSVCVLIRSRSELARISSLVSDQNSTLLFSIFMAYLWHYDHNEVEANVFHEGQASRTAFYTCGTITVQCRTFYTWGTITVQCKTFYTCGTITVQCKTLFRMYSIKSQFSAKPFIHAEQSQFSAAPLMCGSDGN